MTTVLGLRRWGQPKRALAWARRQPVAYRCAAAVIVLFAALAVAAPWVAPLDPNGVDLSAAYQGPSARHLLGTDASGRDLASRLLWGARLSLLGPLAVTLVATTLGAALGVASGWMSGWRDSVMSRVLDLLFSFPGLLLALLGVALLGPGVLTGAAAVTVAYMPYIARLTRVEAIREIRRPYARILRSQGMSRLAVTGKHVLPNLAPTIAGLASAAFGYAMVDLAALSFLGIGVQPPAADWGVMVASGEQGILQGYPLEALLAGTLIVLTVTAFTLLGDHVANRQATQ